MRSISPFERPPEPSMRIDCSLPVAWSLAPTDRMPLASMSKVTAICGTPRGAGGIPSRKKRPISRLSPAMSRSPWSTRISTCGWLSAAVENTWLRLVGIVVLRSISLVMTPPSVSMPSESGVTSRSSTSLTSPATTPPRNAAHALLHCARQHAALDRRADRHHLVGVHALVRLLAEQLLDPLLHQRDAGRA